MKTIKAVVKVWNDQADATQRGEQGWSGETAGQVLRSAGREVRRVRRELKGR